MSTLLVKNASIFMTIDDQRREITGGGLLIHQGKIEQVCPTSGHPTDVDELLDLSEISLLNSQDRKQ